jgi:cobalt-zinc-cadmium efflux system outer membrane protein
MKRIILYLIVSGICLSVAIIASTQMVNAQRILTYDEYMKNVREKNIEYIVERYNVAIAEANTQAAKVIPDPELSFAYENNQDKTLEMGQMYAAELSYTLELGGKSSARIAVAKSEQEMTEALVEDYFRNLRADATLCYLGALRQKHLVDLALSSYRSMKDLARVDSLRYALGEIAEVDAMQSRLEATTMMTDYLQTEVEYKNILFDLVVFEGGMESIDSLSGELPLVIRAYQLQGLITIAQDNRADLKAAIRNRELSVANLRLAKANRVIDLGLNVGFAHNTAALNEEAYSPKFNTFSAGISIPLMFSNFNKGELRAAEYSKLQAEVGYDAVLLQIRKEVNQCYNNYISACRQAELYQKFTLADATSILEKKKYSYTRGETSLLELLDAQRTANEVFQNYYEALYNANASLVELCRAVGIWEVAF